MSKEELPVFDFFIGEFDTVEPLGEYDFFMYAEVADELADSYSKASFRFGFYDQFDNSEMAKNKAFEDEPIPMCPYYYTITLK